MDKTAEKQQTPSIEWDTIERHRHGVVKEAVLSDFAPFFVRVTVKHDYDYDFTEFRGKFTDIWEEGAIHNPNAYCDRSVLKYFVPEVTIAEHRKGLIEQGYSKGVAEEMARGYVKQAMLVAADPGQQGYMAVGIIVEARLDSVTLGEDSLWGIEIQDINDAYLDVAALECVENALDRARTKLERLKKY